MGMFDWVDASAIKFPFTTLDRGLFQTKDFDRGMDTLIINADGTLERNRDIYEEVPEEERPYFGKPEWETGFGKLIGCMKVKEVIRDKFGLPERDTIHFYSSIDTENWVDVYADVENHKIVQFRWEMKKFHSDNVEQLESGVVLLTTETK
jgi:hypothetical protein